MEVELKNVTKSYGQEEVLRDLSFTFTTGSRVALLGPNGSGKSTVMRLVGGFISPGSGSVIHRQGSEAIDPESVYRHISLAAPYLGLYEDLELEELVRMHVRFKPFRNGLSPVDVIRIALLERSRTKIVRNFSSGMKQRLKLALAVLSDTDLLLLDEPVSNLDNEGIAWFQALLAEHADLRTVLIASNRQHEETTMCTADLDPRTGVHTLR